MSLTPEQRTKKGRVLEELQNTLDRHNDRLEYLMQATATHQEFLAQQPDWTGQQRIALQAVWTALITSTLSANTEANHVQGLISKLEAEDE
jgi:hypothetical protein